MKSSNGIILNIYEAQLDPTHCGLSKLNAQVIIIHGNIELLSNVAQTSDFLPKWNQTFHLESQSQTLELKLIHKPLLLREIPLASCTLTTMTQSGWVHLYKSNEKIGSLRLSISSESIPLDPDEISDLYQKKVFEVQTIKSKLNSYKLQYESEKTDKKAGNPKIEELMSALKIEQDLYLKLVREVNEKKSSLKEQEEEILIEKERIAKAKEELRKEECRVLREQKLLQEDFEGLLTVKNKLSLKERILKGYHRNSKSEGKSAQSPVNRGKTSLAIPCLSAYVSYSNSNK